MLSPLIQYRCSYRTNLFTLTKRRPQLCSPGPRTYFPSLVDWEGISTSYCTHGQHYQPRVPPFPGQAPFKAPDEAHVSLSPRTSGMCSLSHTFEAINTTNGGLDIFLSIVQHNITSNTVFEVIQFVIVTFDNS